MMHKKAGFNGWFYNFSVVCRALDTSNINIHKFVMKKHNVKQCLGLSQVFTTLLTGTVSASDHTKCKALSNQKYWNYSY